MHTVKKNGIKFNHKINRGDFEIKIIEKKTFFGTDLYACIRFISQGFKKPSKDEINILFQSMSKMPMYKFKRNKEKVLSYVGGKEKAKKIVKRMGLSEDVFSIETIKKLRSKNYYN